jgi:hypothetical protein
VQLAGLPVVPTKVLVGVTAENVVVVRLRIAVAAPR